MAFGTIDQLPEGLPFISTAFAVRIVEGVAASAFLTASYTLMAQKFTTQVSSTFAYLEAAFGVGLIVGPTIGGAIYEVAGFAFPFVALGAFLVIGFPVLHWAVPVEKNDEDAKMRKAGDEDGLGVASKPNALGIVQFMHDWGALFDSLAIITSLQFIGFNSATLEPHLRQFG